MAESPIVGARVEEEWVEQINAIAQVTGRKPAEVVREAIAAYLGKTDPKAIRSVLVDHENRLANVESKLSSLGRLIG